MHSSLKRVLTGIKSQLISHSKTPASPTKKHEPEYSEDAYYNIEPLHNFDVENKEPLKIRPFKPKFHMTMGTSHFPNRLRKAVSANNSNQLSKTRRSPI